MKIILPLPPSDNERLINNPYMGRMVLSSKYRKRKEYLQEYVKAQLIKQGQNIFPIYEPTYESQLPIEVRFYLKDKMRDAMNMFKPLLDVMSKVIYKDDKWVVPQIQFPYKIDKMNPRVEVDV